MVKIITINTGVGVVIYPHEMYRLNEEREVLLDVSPVGFGAYVRCVEIDPPVEKRDGE